MRMQQAMGVASFLVLLSLLVCSCMGAIPRRSVVAQGYVFCNYCKIDPNTTIHMVISDLLPGARVKLVCNNTKKSWEEETTTDEEGRYMFRPSSKKLTTWGAHKCKFFLVGPSPRQECLYLEYNGVSMKPAEDNTTSSSQLFIVTPLAFYPISRVCP